MSKEQIKQMTLTMSLGKINPMTRITTLNVNGLNR